MKKEAGYHKLRGGYYTPKIIADFLVAWAIQKSDDIVLEPSCGDGVFLSSAQSRLTALHNGLEIDFTQITGIEIDNIEANKAKTNGVHVINRDFFTVCREELFNKRTYDVIVGNPPFIRYQNVDTEIRDAAFSLMRECGFKPNKLTNMWVPFLLLSAKLLGHNGRLGMVIPAELFQVNYAAEAREFLSGFFTSVTIITFRELVFDDIQQEVVLLMAEKNGVEAGIRVIELDNLTSLSSLNLDELSTISIKELDHSTEKWVKYYLNSEELDLVRKLEHSNLLTPTTELFEVNVGIVSGENKFFVIPQDIVKKFGLSHSVLPIIGRADQTSGISLTHEDMQNLIDEGKSVFLFHPSDSTPLDSGSQSYIQYGEENGYSKNYKCRIRDKWYVVPLSWKPEAFLIRQANLYSRIILNQAESFVTDTLHKIRFKSGINPKHVTAAFLNTYTLAQCEMVGRSYGGGVLTFEPSEIRMLKIPMINSDKLDFHQIDDWQKKGDIISILKYTDKVLL